MSTALSIAALALAAVLATAGLAKLADLDGSRRAMADFGVPSRLAPGFGVLLPVAELITAAVLIAGAVSYVPIWIGGLASVCLLAAFSAAIAASLAGGRAPDCHCFGQLHSAPAGPRTLARNGALLVLAAFVAGAGDPIPIVGAAVLALTLLAGAIVRSSPAPVRGADAEGLSPGASAPEFRLPDPAGRVHTLGSLLARGRPVLLVFSDPDCGPCTALAPDVARWQRDHAAELTIAVIEAANGDRDHAVADPHGRRGVLRQRDSEVADLYRAHGTPSAVLIGRDGTIARPVAGGGDRIEGLVAEAVADLEPRRSGALWLRRLLGPELRRRELIARSAAAWAATSAVLAWPARAVAAARRAEPCEDSFDCPEHRFMHCRDGRCVCEQGYTRCNPREATDRRCFDLQSNRDHCGSCNNACAGADHDVCCEGRCGEFGRTRCDCAGEPCPGEHDICVTNEFGTSCFPSAEFGWQRCGDECADPDTHRCCGDRLYVISELGPGRWKCCGSRGRRRLVNIDFDPKHCGGCDDSCPQDSICTDGRCRPCRNHERVCRGGGRSACYDPDRQGCCFGDVYDKRELACCHFNGVTYDPDEFMCCEDGLIEASPDQFFCP